jgi:hypothetical protein
MYQTLHKQSTTEKNRGRDISIQLPGPFFRRFVPIQPFFMLFFRKDGLSSQVFLDWISLPFFVSQRFVSGVSYSK